MSTVTFAGRQSSVPRPQASLPAARPPRRLDCAATRAGRPARLASSLLGSLFPGLTPLAAAGFSSAHNTRGSFGETVWGRLFGAGPCLFSAVGA